jgi:UDP-N-acetylmuramoyl-L-alanyl-D-glutamate--2,6-diaminopimelate ligase
VRLQDLLARLPEAVVSGPADVTVTDVVHDSRAVQPGALFVAIRGLKDDGNAYVEAALRKGATSVVSEQPAPPGTGTTWVQVGDARRALAVAAAILHGEPAQQLELVGVTGTNGKTTTTYVIDAILREAGRTVGLLGTIEYRIGVQVIEAVRTTPESSDLQRLFRQMVAAGCSHAVLEVSSHSLVLRRVHGCPFRVAVFTNLTRDHLDFHGDMESYFVAKRILFDELLRADGHAIINAEDDWGRKLADSLTGRNVLTFGLREPADILAVDLDLSLTGTRFRARTPAGTIDIASPLLGLFNVRNMLGAIGAATALGLDAAAIRRALAAFTGVPGRLERVDAGQDFTVVVDYAHTDDGLKNLLETVRALKPRRVITVFGCGGDRDRTKRPLMGAVASRLSDIAIVTSDNPRSEPPESILAEIQRGMNGGRGAQRHLIVDRREAITRALELAEPGDAVVIAGKGHETYQVIRDKQLPFDDRQVARDLLARRAAKRSS